MKVFLLSLCLVLAIVLCNAQRPRIAIASTARRGISECAAKGGECDESKGRPVCGTDGSTYPTRCHLIRAQCSGHPVSLKHRGPCKNACVASRSYALAHRSVAKFVPRCRADGSYAPVQCLENVGCWCVNGQGKPFPNTTVQHGRPPGCAKKGKSNQRRSSPRNPVVVRAKKNCSPPDRVIFNTNLVKIFNSEYKRFLELHSKLSTPSSTTDKIVIDWKFSNMDSNNNHMLDKNEYRELKRLIKKVVKPKRCARSFGKFCDLDQDERLSRQEWSACLSKELPKDFKNPAVDSTLDTNNHGAHKHGGHGDGGTSSSTHKIEHNPTNINSNSNNNNNNNNNNMQLSGSLNSNVKTNNGHLSSYGGLLYDDDEDDDEEEEDFEHDSSDELDLPEHNQLIGGPPIRSADKRYQSHLWLRGKTTLELRHEDPTMRENDGESDCLSDRSTALDEQKAGQQALYVPECTADGRYQRVQCYRSTGYCWCVHEDTGKNIPGTSTKDKRPQCDAIVPSSRPMKGCPDQKKSEFLKDLKEFLKKQIAANGNLGTNTTKWGTEDEKIATLSFVLLDKNKNKVWERKEWKTFRDSVTAIRPLRKCGKKMPRYCDVNSDKKITLSEWLNCLQAQRQVLVEQNSTTESKAPVPSKLRGPNPLESYLKSD